MTKRIPETAWATELLRFTSRNAGRATKVEIDSMDFGAHPLENGMPLRGIAYDSRDARVMITLGNRSDAADQFTHSVDGADAIYVLVDLRGRDEALAIVHDHSQTLLRFLDLT